jgi:hypothetical protein
MVWWCKPVTPALEKLRHEDLRFKFEASLGYLSKYCFNKRKTRLSTVSNTCKVLGKQR